MAGQLVPVWMTAGEAAGAAVNVVPPLFARARSIASAKAMPGTQGASVPPIGHCRSRSPLFDVPEEQLSLFELSLSVLPSKIVLWRVHGPPKSAAANAA